jgi:hypothetical protein
MRNESERSVGPEAAESWQGVPLRGWFLAALVAGALAIAFGERFGTGSTWITVGGPLLVMGAYVAIGWRIARGDVSRTQFADSVYYLGFLFTLVSLTAAIVELGPAGEPWRIVDRFGVKLTTTLVGLGFRVYLVNFKPSLEDTTENVEESLARAAHALRARMEEVTLDLDALSSSLGLTLKGASERVAGELTSTISQGAAFFSESVAAMKAETGASLTEMRDATTGAVASTGKSVGAALEAMERELGASVARVAAASTELGARIESARLPEDAFTARLGPALEALATTLEQPGQRIAAAATALEAPTRRIGEAGQRFEAAAAQFETALAAVRGLADEAERLSASLEPAGAKLTALAALGDDAAQTRAALDRLTSAASESARTLEGAGRRAEEIERVLGERLRQAQARAAALEQDQARVAVLLRELEHILALAREKPAGGLLRRLLGRRDDV